MPVSPISVAKDRTTEAEATEATMHQVPLTQSVSGGTTGGQTHVLLLG